MRRQTKHVFSLDTDPIVPGALSDSYTPFLPELTHEELGLGGEPLDVLNFDMNSWSSTVEESFPNTMLSERNTGTELQLLMDNIDQLEEYHTNSNPTNPMLTFSEPGASTSSQLSSPSTPSINSHAVPIIRSEHQSYLCSWHLHDPSARCDHVAPERRAFLHHLGAMHQVSGDPETAIVCGLLDSKMGSTCGTQIKRANFARHVDTHYPVRYHCQYCPVDTSFSRQDSWRKHMRSKHE